ncbi:Os07g0404500 [Oryza sativa Japonica Group]|uniref:Os07g0404500 protein n=1 Tax=Oryza sativa subsp. japonica TaxID=39947 RepID=C7J4M3_ORYSJ|nr:Os07g0404500 [Oryza sativa Japonica Group]|eukprot:NP_001175153.1 Os07g0404500 [Oryza sativa Japonica Group]
MGTFAQSTDLNVGSLVVKPGINQTQGRSAAPGTPRLDAYSERMGTRVHGTGATIVNNIILGHD